MNQVKLTFKPHKSQEEISNATITYPRVVIRAGRRFGKSSLALNIVLREALHNPGRYWIVAPEYRQVKSIYWLDLVREYIPEEIIIKKNDTELYLEIMSLVDGKTSIIEFKGSDREDKLRGAGLKGVVLDEYAFQKEQVWDKILSPMLAQTDGWAIFITTPNGVANHFKKFWDDTVATEAKQSSDNAWEYYKEEIELSNEKDNGDRKPTKEGFNNWKHRWKTFHFTSYDNPTIKRENLDSERGRLTEEFFAQEFMADFAKFVGLIYTGFDDKKHVQEFEVDENWTFYRALDFGATDPNAMPFIGVDRDGIIHVFDEVYINNIYTSELAELIKQKSAHRYFVATYADSAAKQSIMDLGQYGVFCTPVAKNSGENARNWLIAGIDQVHQLLKENKIIIHPRCKGLIKEFMSYSWRKDRMGEAVNIPEDKNNHLLDAFRYFVVSYKGPVEEKTFNYLQKPVDSITGY